MLRSALFVIVNLLISTLLAQSNCKVSQAPLCPTSGSLALSELYPASAFVVSTASKMYTKSGEAMASNFLLSVIEAYHYDETSLPALIVPTNKDDYQTLKATIESKLKEKRLPPKKRQAILNSLINIETTGYLWQQDYMQSLFDPQTGTPQVGIVSRYDRTPIGVERQLTNQKFNCAPDNSYNIGRSQKIVSHSVVSGFDGGGFGNQGLPNFGQNRPNNPMPEQWYEGEPGDQNSKMGGNIESLPAGICLTGNNMSDEYLSEWCRDPSNAVKVDVSWLTVGHVDEVVKVIPTGTGSSPCNYAVMIASPKKAFELLQKDGQESFYTYPENPDDQYRSHLTSKMTYSYFPGEIMCRLYENTIRDLSPQEQEKINLMKVQISLLQYLIGPALAKESYPGEICHQELDRMKGITNGEYLYALKKDEELWETNLLIQKKMDQAKSEITKKLKKALPQCGDTKFIDVPNIFTTDGLVDGKDGKELPSPGSGNSILPNPTNSVVANKTVIFPDPNNATFKNYLARELNIMKTPTSFVDTWDTSHLGHGNLHCITNSLRYCRPK